MATPNETLWALTELAPLLGRLREESPRRYGLTLARQRLLLLLQHDGPMVSVDAARHLAVSPRAVSALVDGLESMGLARRVPHPTDGRAALVELTTAGRAAAARMAESHDRFAESLLADQSDEDLQTALDVVELVHRRIQERFRIGPEYRTERPVTEPEARATTGGER
jgi:DNA-binding MarR family transcriptional regulator